MQVEVSNPDIPRGSGGIFFKRPEGVCYLRFYGMMLDGKAKFGKKLVSHWEDGKRYDCSDNSSCPYCKRGVKQTYRMRVGVIDRKNVEGGMKLFDLPLTLWDQLYTVLKENGAENVLGDKGLTMAVTFDKSKKAAAMYSLTPVLKDKKVLNFESKMLPWNPPQKGEGLEAYSDIVGDVFDAPGVDDVVETAEASGDDSVDLLA